MQEPASNPPDSTLPRARRWWIWLVPLVALILVNTRVAGWLGEWVRGLESLGPWMLVVFIGAITLAVVLLVPTGPMTLGAGYMMGFARGCPAVLVGMTVGAALGFLIARHLLRSRIERAASRRPELSTLDEAVSTEGWKLIFLIRLIPFFPSKLANYVFGVTRVGFWPYLLASFFGFIPNTISSVYIASLAREVAGSGASDRKHTPMEWVVWGMGLIAIVVFSVTVSRIARRVYHARFRQP